MDLLGLAELTTLCALGDGSGRHSGEFVLSSVGTSHQWVAGYGNATLLLYSQMVNKMQTQMSLHIGHSPMSEPILLYINTLPALKQLIQTEPHKQVARTILLYTTTPTFPMMRKQLLDGPSLSVYLHDLLQVYSCGSRQPFCATSLPRRLCGVHERLVQSDYKLRGALAC